MLISTTLGYPVSLWKERKSILCRNMVDEAVFKTLAGREIEGILVLPAG